MDGNGEWSGPATLPPGPASVALVDATGNVVCSAPLGGTAVS